MMLISIFGVAFLPGLSRAHAKSLRIQCLWNLRQVGMALQLYAHANEDWLPGPVSAVPQAGYDETSSRQELAWYIAESLRCPKPSTNTAIVKELLCPAYGLPWAEAEALVKARTYALNENISKQASVRVPPFGTIVQPGSVPLKLSDVAKYGSPFRIVASTDADKRTVNPTLSFWNEMPYRPVHGKSRSELFFDGHVQVKSW